MVIAVGLASCGGDDTAAANGESHGCSINSDCNNPLVCAFKYCHKQCTTARDCPTGQRCVLSTDADTGEILGKVCQLPEEATKQCTRNSDCPGLQICGIDSKCRDQCVDARDCPLTTQLCINHTCADPGEAPDGGLPQTNDAGMTRDGESLATTTGGGMGGSGMGGSGMGGSGMGGSGMGGSGMGGSGMGGSSSDAGPDVSMGGSSGTDAGRDVSQDPVYDGPCGHADQPCCMTGQACTLGSTCNASMMCVACGRKDQPCCGTSCLETNLDCVANKCSCGESNQVCCGGTMCSAGLTCSLGVDGGRSNCACGGNGQVCCPGSMCSSASLSCLGIKCSCVKACAGDHASGYGPNVLRSDGTVWFYTGATTAPTPVTDASMVPVTGFTKVATSSSFSCGIKGDKTTWCWANANNNSTTPNSYGELGDGTTNWSKFPVQVVKGTLTVGDYLTNAIDISTFGSTTCAVTDGGTTDPADDYVWCWGYGSYGQRGDGSNSPGQPVATKVVIAAQQNGPPLTGIDQVSVGSDHTCAHQRPTNAGEEGNAFCWGQGSYGQLGDGMTMATNYAVKSSGLNNGVSQVAVGYYTTCARTGPDVWCWGFTHLGNGSAAGVHTMPSQVLVAADAGVFTGVVDVRPSNGNFCALVGADKSLWCWTGTGFPTNATAGGFPVNAVSLWDMDSTNVCFVKTDGDMYFQNQKVTRPVACP
jgi:hypothetical protein